MYTCIPTAKAPASTDVARKSPGYLNHLALALGLAITSSALADTTTTATLAPGVIYRHHTYTSMFGAPQSTYVVDIDLNVPGVGLSIAGNSGTLKTVANHAATVSGALAAVNGNMFSGSTMIEYVKRGGASISPSATYAGNITMAGVAKTSRGALSVVLHNGTDWPSTVAAYTDALTGHPRLVSEGNNDTFDPNDHDFAGARNPRTCASWTYNNHLMIVDIDGRLSNAAGMTCPEEQSYLNSYAASHGTSVRSAINFDGGGSTTMWRSGVGVVNQPSDGVARVVVDALVVTYTTPPSVAAQVDYNGDGNADYTIFRPSDGSWHIKHSDNSGFTGFTLGQSGDKALSGDFSGDTKADAVIFRPSTGAWYVRFSQDAGVHTFNFGQSTDIPLVGGDFTGDGVDDAVVFRPSTGTWYVRFSEDGALHSFQFGQNGDIPLLGGDFDADRSPDAVLFRPSTATWYVRSSRDGTFKTIPFGQSTDIPVVGGDYSGDGIPDLVLFRPSTGMWYVRFSQDASIHSFQFGQSGDIPMAGFNVTGGATPDYTLYRPSTGTWYVRSSVTGTFTSVAYGVSTDVPVH